MKLFIILLSLLPQISNYGFQPIGFLDGTAARSEAIAVSGDGDTVVGLSSYNGGYTGSIWTEVDGLQRLAPPDGWHGEEGLAEDISHDGSVIVGSDIGPNSRTRSVGWFDLSPTGLDQTPQVSSYAKCVSPNGRWIVITKPAGAVTPEIVLWKNGEEFISTGQRSILPLAVSNKGQIVGYDYLSPVEKQAVRWTHRNGWEYLFPEQSLATDISANGQIITGSLLTEDGWRSYRWVKGEVELLPFAVNSYAVGMSHNGEIIVGNTVVKGEISPYIWNIYTGTTMIRETLEANNISLRGFFNLIVTDVSDNGSVIVGTGRNSTGNYEGFVIEFPVIEDPDSDKDPDG